MVRAEVEGDRLTHEEMIAQCRLLLIAGNVTTTDLIGNGTRALLDFPEQMDKLRADTHHQSFGGGRHLCLGAHLARVEAQEAILGLLRRFPRLRKSARGHVFHAIPSFRGMREFWVRCD